MDGLAAFQISTKLIIAPARSPAHLSVYCLLMDDASILNNIPHAEVRPTVIIRFSCLDDRKKILSPQDFQGLECYRAAVQK
jgi:biotin synthase-related radical SAM superfamily protein